MKVLHAFMLLASIIFAAAAAEGEWDALNTILESAIDEEVWPGCTAAVFTKDEVLFKSARGYFTYGIPPPETPDENPAVAYDTLYDLASCTKVVAGTSSIALLYQYGDIVLDDPVYKYLPGFEANGKESVTIRHLLLHNSGLPADPRTGYPSKAFDCPETSSASPQHSFSCRSKCYHQLLEQTLDTPAGTNYVYSDMSLMAIMNVVGHVARDRGYISEADLLDDCPPDTDGWEQCYYEAFARKYVFQKLGMPLTGYLPDKALWKNCAPTVNESTFYRYRQIQGEVHDENTFAMGGISGHAGLFSTVEDLIPFTRAWLFAGEDGANGFLNRSTVDTFVKQFNHSQSSRALGWNTNAEDAPDYGWSHACGSLSETTFMHIGFTGTLICADPERQMGLVLLDNRVYPDTSTATRTSEYRRKFATMAQEIFDSIYGN